MSLLESKHGGVLHVSKAKTGWEAKCCQTIFVFWAERHNLPSRALPDIPRFPNEETVRSPECYPSRHYHNVFSQVEQYCQFPPSLIRSITCQGRGWWASTWRYKTGKNDEKFLLPPSPPPCLSPAGRLIGSSAAFIVKNHHWTLPHGFFPSDCNGNFLLASPGKFRPRCLCVSTAEKKAWVERENKTL